MFKNTLNSIGLSKGEILVYTKLLDLGKSPVSKIHEKTGIERRNIYDILNKLIEKGLITYAVENKKKLYEVSHPKKIIGYLEEKKLELDRTKKEVEKEIPDILKKYKLMRSKINTETYTSVEGVKVVWEDMLNHKEILWIGSGRYVPDQLPYFFTHWNRKRVKSKIKMFNLIRNELRGKIKKLGFEFIKFLPKEFSVNPAVVCIYGNKVVNFSFEKEFFAFVIENKKIAENYKKYHKYLWDKVAKP